VKGEDPATPGPLKRNDPGTITIPQYRVDKTKHNTHSWGWCCHHSGTGARNSANDDTQSDDDDDEPVSILEEIFGRQVGEREDTACNEDGVDVSVGVPV